MSEDKKDEQEYVKLAYEVSVYREQLKLLEREVQRIHQTSIELQTAAQTCEKLQTDNALMPIGGGAFIHARVESTKALVPVGSNYLISMERDKAVLELHKRVDAAKSASEKLREEYKKIVHKLQQSSGLLQSIQSRLALSHRVDENIGEDYI
ncbi:MAG TPA: prefoldin subunit alpha [Candidatus Bilamarchaeaceae archaeon]|nr:prefoldin subunit alpha [Candidatus Bilamarchaeaceae archaeon]